LFDYTLSSRSLNHHGILFDALLQQLRYGGDPNNVSRPADDKNDWYDLQVMFRRDQNFWNYNLFLNPFNQRHISNKSRTNPSSPSPLPRMPYPH